MLRTLALAMIAVTLGACGEHEKLARYREPRDGWTVSYPVSMIPRAIGYSKGMLSDRGVVISSSPRVRVTDEAAFRRFPRDAVAFGLFRSFGGPAAGASEAGATVPLDRAAFTAVRGAPPPKLLEHDMTMGGSRWAVRVWFGPDASSEDKEKVWRIVRSIGFPQH